MIAPTHQVMSVVETAVLDRLAISAGTPGILLMERAGRAVAQAVLSRYPRQDVLVLAGPGNNGGDGFVAARHLAAAGWPVRLALACDPHALKGDADHHSHLWRGAIEFLSTRHAEGAPLIIDALFGAGLRRPLSGVAAEVVRLLNQRKARVIAIDLPSGVAGDSGEVLGGLALTAELTVTFCAKKPAHLLLPGRNRAGQVVVADIGIEEKLIASLGLRTYENVPQLFGPALRWRASEHHKYDFGSLLIRAGAMTGAARLAGLAALRAGAGMVSIAAPPHTLLAYAAAPAALILAPSEGDKGWADLAADPRRSAFLIGPGNGVTLETDRAARLALRTGKPVVLDADALTVFADRPDEMNETQHHALVLTPHEGEFVRLFPDLAGSRLERARAAAKRLSATVVLKGADTVIAAYDGRAAIADNAPPWLATAGSGDVLSGIIAALLAQGVEPFMAAAAGVWMHGEAAALAGLGMIADDLPSALPSVLKRLKSICETLES